MAWHKFFVAGLVGSVAIVGCTVTTTSDKGDGGGTGGTGNGGTAAGGGGTGNGGTAAGGGGTGSGGKASGGTGGSAGGTFDGGPDKPCTICLKTKCAAEYADCLNDAVCLENKTTHELGEFPKIQQCMFPFLADSGAGVFTAADLAQCAGDNAVGSVPSKPTQALITCAHGAEDASTQPCTTECFGDTIPF
jgi:hypothetical protein